jgi:hypothetical protein
MESQGTHLSLLLVQFLYRLNAPDQNLQVTTTDPQILTRFSHFMSFLKHQGIAEGLMFTRGVFFVSDMSLGLFCREACRA